MEKTSKKAKIELVHTEEAARLKALFDARAKMSQMSFGAENNIGSQGMVWHYLNARAPLNLGVAIKFAAGLNCDVSDFSPRLAEALALVDKLNELRMQPYHDMNKSNAERAPVLAPAVKVPVVGTAQLGDNGHWAEMEYPVGHGDGYVEHSSRDPHAYALRCLGDSMKPRIKNGEFVVVYPGHEAHPGDEVLVQISDGRVMVKELLYIRDGMLHLMSVNEAHGKLVVKLADVVKIHYVAAILKKATWAPE